ncbi:MAG: hypothetical protein JXR05_09355 [Flavobacteriaceae bacterium]
MKIKNSLLIVLLATTFLLGCKSEPKKKSTDTETIKKDTIVNTDSETKEYEPSDDDIREYGIIERVEDATYPFFEVTLNFVERNIKQDFNLSIESISLTDSELYKLKGKYATIYYTSDLVNDLVDLHFEGKSLFGEYAPDMNSNWKKIIGTLSGAESVSGDLPGKVTVTDSNGQKIEFELYIDDETVKANGKTVTAFYTLEGVNTVTHIEPST